MSKKEKIECLIRQAFGQGYFYLSHTKENENKPLSATQTAENLQSAIESFVLSKETLIYEILQTNT